MKLVNVVLMLSICAGNISCSDKDHKERRPRPQGTSTEPGVFNAPNGEPISIPPGKLLQNDHSAFDATSIHGPLQLSEGFLVYMAERPGNHCTTLDVEGVHPVAPHNFLRWLQKSMVGDEVAFLFDSDNSTNMDLHIITKAEIFIEKHSDTEALGQLKMEERLYTFRLVGQWLNDTFTADSGDWTGFSTGQAPEAVLTSEDCR